MELTPDEARAVMAQRAQAIPPPLPEPEKPQSVRLKLHLVEHGLEHAEEHAAAVNAVLEAVVAPTGLLRPPKVEYVATDGRMRLVTEIWVAEPINQP